jgi:hypothetical protein
VTVPRRLSARGSQRRRRRGRRDGWLPVGDRVAALIAAYG